ncbi:unnamed protein product [Protopolystoma xenopodis]|uniref:Protein-tyrosine-phosphatase n=1 Tax=Protopolystoma xenopodis TaxID=117903 RepID=A0A3S5BG49_9PLAT|nr:unnamed protein product [Protopolystoma xenopodis]
MSPSDNRFATTYSSCYGSPQSTGRDLEVRSIWRQGTANPTTARLASSSMASRDLVLPASRVAKGCDESTLTFQAYPGPAGVLVQRTTGSLIGQSRYASTCQPITSRQSAITRQSDSGQPISDVHLASSMLPPRGLPSVRASLASGPASVASWSHRGMASGAGRTYTSTYSTLVGAAPPPASSGRGEAGCNRQLVVDPTSNPLLHCPAVGGYDLNKMFSQIARVTDHLYLSSLNALTPDRLRQNEITLLVSAMIDPPPAALRSAVANSLHISVEDVESTNLGVHFDRVADRIAAEARRGGRALVHCMAGISRSTSLVLAYLVRHRGMSLAEAYQLVRSVRPCVQPNPSFWRQLVDYEERLRGGRSVRLVPSGPVHTHSPTACATPFLSGHAYSGGPGCGLFSLASLSSLSSLSSLAGQRVASTRPGQQGDHNKPRQISGSPHFCYAGSPATSNAPLSSASVSRPAAYTGSRLLDLPQHPTEAGLIAAGRHGPLTRSLFRF